jgi:ABC-type sugar transport system ATPase subunit
MDSQGTAIDTQPEEALLLAEGVSKHYPGVQALSDVTLSLAPGEVHALVGENGAGKSTLIKVLGGLVEPTAGVLRVGGRPQRFSGPQESQAAGISVISQEFRLVPQLTVAENMFLGHEPTRFGLVDRAKARRLTREPLRELGLNISPDRRVDSLTVGDQQLVEIARALSREFRVLILDEPTAALSESEAEKLLTLVQRIRDRGCAVLYVSHRLPEIFRVSDRISVLRDGRLVARLRTADTTAEEVVTHMLGRPLEMVEAQVAAVPAEVHEKSAPPLRVSGLRCAGLLAPVDLQVAAGEVVGIAGLVGSGRTELLRALFGAIASRSDRFEVEGRPVRPRSPADAIGSGIFMLSEDRKAEGIVPLLSVLDNVVLAQRRWGRFLLNPGRDRSSYQAMKDRMRIRVDDPQRLITTLSGGNQQKALLGRALLSDCRVLLLNEPTRGVDVGAKVEIYQLIRELAATGVGVVVSSSEAAELVAVADRCLTLYAGSVSGELSADRMTEADIVAGTLGHTGAATSPATAGSQTTAPSTPAKGTAR